MFISLTEIIDIIMMTLFIGFIFSKFFKKKTTTKDYDPLKQHQKNTLLEDIKWGAIIAAPAVVLHELAHKFVAMSFGAQAVLHAPSFFGIPYGMYILVLLLIYFKFPIIFFVGGYVAHSALPLLPSALVSISGPFVNLILWGGCVFVIKNKLINKKHWESIILMGKLNMFLFIFNMLPIPGFDGWHFFSALFKLLGF